MPHRVAALAGHATVYDAEDNAVCQTKGPDAEATANRIARALDAAPALLEACEAVYQSLWNILTAGDLDADSHPPLAAAKAAIAAARGN